MIHSDLSSRVRNLPASPASMMRRRAAELRLAGRSVIDLSSGDLSFPTPEHVIEAASQAASAGLVKYSNVDGTPEMKQAVVLEFSRRYGLAYRLDEIIVGTGSTQLLFNALMATLHSGDEVIIPRPYWAPS